MKFVIATLASVAVAFEESQFRFMEYMANHGKSYTDAVEFEMRYENWLRIDKFIVTHNADPKETHTVGHNYLSDWSKEEKSKLSGLKKPRITPVAEPAAYHSRRNKWTAGRDLDWRDRGMVTPVKDQAQCGSCWSFSATGCLESAWAIAGNTLTSLSEQQLVSCSWRQGNLGCGGGFYTQAWNYLTNHMSMTEDSYPYTAKSEFQECYYNESDGVTFVASYINVTPNNPFALIDALESGPVSVAVEADQDAFHQYTSGVVTGDSCGTATDHAILAVGFGTDESGTEFYYVKNSWGTGWGEDGYIKIGVAEGEGICGIQTSPAQVYV